MFEKFKIWSRTNLKVKDKICPDLGMRSWSLLSPTDKQNMWLYFVNKSWFKERSTVYYAVEYLNEIHKAKSYGKSLLEHGGPHFDWDSFKGINFFRKCCLSIGLSDFRAIFINDKEDVVLELLSLYAKLLINEEYLENLNISNDEAHKKSIDHAYKEFDQFALDLNDIFEQFGVNYLLSRKCFIPRQDEKILQEIYIPVMKFLSDKRWKEVNSELEDAFLDFRKKTPNGYSSCVTHAITTVEAYLQLLIYNKIGKGTLGSLIDDAQKKALIPNDFFTKQIFCNIENFFAKERKETGDAHPKEAYATEKNALLVLNLVMIFLQHCLGSSSSK